MTLDNLNYKLIFKYEECSVYLIKSNNLNPIKEQKEKSQEFTNEISNMFKKQRKRKRLFIFIYLKIPLHIIILIFY